MNAEWRARSTRVCGFLAWNVVMYITWALCGRCSDHQAGAILEVPNLASVYRMKYIARSVLECLYFRG